VAGQLLDLATAGEDEEQLLQARRALGTILFHLGEFAPACEHLEAAIVLYDGRHRPQTSPYIANPGVACLSLAAFTWWMLGYPDRALARC
jgi:hypothetical protein